MATASLIVPVRRAVVAGLVAAVNDRKVQITYGWSGDDEARHREQIYTNRPRATHEQAAMKSGRRSRTEQMDFDLVIFVAGPGQRPDEVDDRVMELGAIVEDFFAETYDGGLLGVAGVNWIIPTAFELENRIGANGALSLGQYTVRYNARLT